MNTPDTASSVLRNLYIIAITGPDKPPADMGVLADTLGSWLGRAGANKAPVQRFFTGK